MKIFVGQAEDNSRVCFGEIQITNLAQKQKNKD
jgi:hypothetical protein